MSKKKLPDSKAEGNPTDAETASTHESGTVTASADAEVIEATSTPVDGPSEGETAASEAESPTDEGVSRDGGPEGAEPELELRSDGVAPEEPAPEAAPPAPVSEITSAPEPVLRAHPAADLFPLLGDEQLAELAADIRVRGLVEPIVTIEVDGKVRILDGRNRYRACIVAGVAPRTVAWDGTGGSPSGFVLARNIHRRHLTPSQRAAIAVDLLPMLEAEARERQVAAAAATNARAHLSVVEAVPEPTNEPVVRGRSRDIAAAALGVSGRSVGDAKAIAEAAPEVLVEVRSGTLSIPEGKRIAALPGPEVRKEAIADAKATKGTSKARVPKAAVPAPAATDTLAPVRAAVGSLAKLLDSIPKAERPIWWTPLRAALRAVGAK